MTHITQEDWDIVDGKRDILKYASVYVITATDEYEEYVTQGYTEEDLQALRDNEQYKQFRDGLTAIYWGYTDYHVFTPVQNTSNEARIFFTTKEMRLVKTVRMD